MIKAILYDVDGLMIDSERLGMKIAKQVMKTYRFNLSKKETLSFIGVTDEKFYKDLFKSKELNLNVKDAVKQHFEIYEKQLQTVKVFSGVLESVKRLKPKFKLGVVSGSTRYQVNTILKRIGIDKYFDLVLTCEDYKNSKPNPEPYLLAAHKLKIQPKECIVLEDAPTGIKSAKEAGMSVIAVSIGNIGKFDLSNAAKIVKTLDDVTLDLIKALEK